MKAFVMTRYGGPDVAEMRDVSRPVPGSGEVLVRVHAAGLNPVDFKTRQGQLRPVQRYRMPIVMGNEFAGTIEALGSGVTRLAVGDRVFARVPKATLGAFAEFSTVPEDHLAEMPAALDFATAAGVPLAGLTALQALRDELRLGPGSRVLVTGGAGGVGTFAIQIAKWLGAHVTTTASPRGHALVTRLGADAVIDYTRDRLADHPRDFDGAFDLVGGDALRDAFGVVKRGGTVVSVAGLPEPETARKDLHRGIGLRALFWLASFSLRGAARRHGVHYRYLFMHPSGSELGDLARLIDDGRLVPVIDRVFDFAAIADAFAYLGSGHAKGKVVVRMGDDT